MSTIKPHPLWRPIKEFDGVEETYFIIVSGSPEIGFYDQGKWWCYLDTHLEEVEPTEFMVIPMYRALAQRIEDASARGEGFRTETP